ncbi:MAG: HPr family phosphocarrier protein [Gammaproteobacteria bacterium]|nr:HPr family phosphocarrier protein [Pseudomonadales bacterium]MCP5345523.1 HPr family phosphocarrier protein [Pseudomonadales bacterium]
MIEKNVEIINRAGLHARAASKLVALTSGFSSSIKIGHEKMVDGKSILSLMMLAAVKGTNLKVVAEGEDEEEAVAAIIALVNDRFEEAQ